MMMSQYSRVAVIMVCLCVQVVSPTIEKLEKLLFLVSAIEGNLTEFKKIQKDLYEILNKVKRHNGWCSI